MTRWRAVAAGTSAAGASRPDLPPVRRLQRRADGRVVAGVASGLAEHLALPVTAVRAAFVVMAVLGGSGVLAYALFWLALPLAGNEDGSPPRPASRVQVAVFALACVAALVVLRGVGLGQGAALPLAAAVVGVALVWRQADDAKRARWRATAVSAPVGHPFWRSLAGVALLVGGLAGFLASRGDLAAAREGLLSTAVVIGGLVVLALPWVLRTLQELQAERRERIRSQERADLAAQVHDSVLQTLALIQRSADDPREVARLARSSERELRTWLYRPVSELSFSAGLEAAAAEVEEDFGVPVEVVVVGDVLGGQRDDRLAALTAAAREAVVNACKHAGAPLVQVYAEVEPDQVTVFVRDRGRGFVPELVPADRFGLARSVVDRVARAGGEARVRSAPGEGTEVRLQVAREGAR